VFGAACESASITSVVSKWQYLQSRKQKIVAGGQVRQVGWVGDNSHVVFDQKMPWWKMKMRGVYCHDATASCHQSSGWSLCKFSRCRRKTSH
jgi:hypothetical protein